MLLVCPSPAPAAKPVPLPQAFAHNDECHPRPLLEALERGFCNIEADVHLVSGRLLVAHDPGNLAPDKTLERLYLAPLRDRARANGGRVYPGGPTVRLYLDIKTAPQETYAALRPLLASYRPVLTTFAGGRVEAGAVTVLLTGRRPLDTLLGEPDRLVACDGPLTDLDRPELDPLLAAIGSDWRLTFKWQGKGRMPPSERRRLRDLVARIHRRGKLVRFWAAPDVPAAWAELRDAGVDLINTDDLAGLKRFLSPPASAPESRPAR
jgi:hypothetical protein